MSRRGLTLKTYSSPLIDLAQPSNDREQPSTATALVNTGATIVRKVAEGGPILQTGVSCIACMTIRQGVVRDL